MRDRVVGILRSCHCGAEFCERVGLVTIANNPLRRTGAYCVTQEGKYAMGVPWMLYLISEVVKPAAGKSKVVLYFGRA